MSENKPRRNWFQFNFYTEGEVDDLTARFNTHAPMHGPMRSARAQAIAETIAEALDFDATLALEKAGPMYAIDPISMQPEYGNPIGVPLLSIYTNVPKKEFNDTYWYFNERIAA